MIATPTDKRYAMRCDNEFILQFLMSVYPSSLGWDLKDYSEVDSSSYDFILRQNENAKLVIKMDGPLVSKADIDRTERLLEAYQVLNHGCDVCAILMYGSLLIPPPKLSSSITIISLTEEVPTDENENIFVGYN